MGKTDAERKQAERDRKTEQGLSRYEIWIRPVEWPMVKAFVARVEKARHIKRNTGSAGAVKK